MEPELLVFTRQEMLPIIKELTNGLVSLRVVQSIDELESGLKENGLSIVLIDLEYSGLSAEMAGTFKAFYPDAVKIVLTGRPGLDVVMEFINSGAVFGFVTIPIKPEIFNTLIHRALIAVRTKVESRQLLDKVRQFDSDLGALLMQRMQALEAENHDLKQKVVIDSLTGCFNVRYMRYRLSVEYDKFLRYGEIFSILMLDMDDFKAINDINGHQVGDLALKQAVSIMQSAVRSSDVLIRYGGDEFMIIAPNTGRAGAVRMGERIETGLLKSHIEGRNDKVILSMSIGSVTCEKGYEDGIEELIRHADDALYAAKNSGKKMVITWKDVNKAKEENSKNE